MSESVFARLPRFDDGPAVATVVETEISEREAAPAPDPDALNAARRRAEDDALIAAVSALADAVGRLQAEARAHTADAIRSVSADLFPKLAQAFLTEEIARQLPDLLPRSLRSVEIHAAPEFCLKLESAARQGSTGAVRLDFVSDRQLAPGQVTINWKSGGLEFDAGRLLQASLSDSRPSHAFQKEQKMSLPETGEKRLVDPERRDTSRGNQYRRSIFGVPVLLTVSIGRQRMSVSELLDLRRRIDRAVDVPH